MPIYDYHCDDCGSDFETLVRSMFSTEAITCPDCGGYQVKKAISLFGGLGGASSTKSSSMAANACAPTG